MEFFKAEYELKVSFEDVDMMGIVWHGNYMRYLEQARCDLFSKLNYTYLDMKADGYAYPIAKMEVKYIKPAEFGDILIIKSELAEIEPALIIKYFIYNKKTNEKIFKATTMQIAIDIKTKNSIYTPPERLLKNIERNKI